MIFPPSKRGSLDRRKPYAVIFPQRNIPTVITYLFPPLTADSVGNRRHCRRHRGYSCSRLHLLSVSAAPTATGYVDFHNRIRPVSNSGHDKCHREPCATSKSRGIPPGSRPGIAKLHSPGRGRRVESRTHEKTIHGGRGVRIGSETICNRGRKHQRHIRHERIRSFRLRVAATPTLYTSASACSRAPQTILKRLISLSLTSIPGPLYNTFTGT
jgi:hypothetical protein